MIESIANVFNGLGLHTDTYDLKDEIGFYNIGKECPLLYNVLIGKKFIRSRLIQIEAYFFNDMKTVQIVYSTDNKNYSNDFNNFDDVNSLVQNVYKWIMDENNYKG